MASDIDFNALPAPRIVEELSFEAIVARQREAFVDTWAAIRAANPEAVLPTYDVQLLETDPATIGNQAESYREILLRARINDAAKANLLAFAYDSDLDHLAAFYDVVRMQGELDDRLKERVVLAIKGRSPGGTRERYEFVAMSSDVRVRAAYAYGEKKSPVIRVAIFSDAADGVASPDLLAVVDAALHAPNVIMVNDTIIVSSAVLSVIDVEADYWLEPTAPLTTVNAMEANLRTSWAAMQTLGRDFVKSWWVSKLQVTGVHEVVPISPATVMVDNSAAISIGRVKLNFKGRGL